MKANGQEDRSGPTPDLVIIQNWDGNKSTSFLCRPRNPANIILNFLSLVVLWANLLQPGTIGAQTPIRVAAGRTHSLFLLQNGSLWAVGFNNYGQLGDGTTNNSNRPKLIEPGGVKSVAAGDYYSLYLKNDGTVWAMGENDGQFNGNTWFGTNMPVLVASNATAIAAGHNYCFYIKTLANNIIATFNLDREQTEEIILKANLDVRIRGEALSLEQFAVLTNLLDALLKDFC